MRFLALALLAIVLMSTSACSRHNLCYEDEYTFAPQLFNAS